MTETTDESPVRAQHKINTKNLRKSGEPASAFIYCLYIKR
jgi:hypothetical protein